MRIAALVLATAAAAMAATAAADRPRLTALTPAGPLGTPPPLDPGAKRLPRRVIVKLRPEARICLSCAVALGRSIDTGVAGSRLDELGRRFGVRAARPLVHPHGLAPETPAEADTRFAALAARFPARARRATAGSALPDFARSYVLELAGTESAEVAARAYAADPAVEYCEPDRTVSASFVPNDPYLASAGSWGQPFDDLWGVKRIDAPTAWDTTRGAGVVVAVVDTGIDYTHPDLAANVWTNAGEIPGNGIDDDGNGFVDDVRGWDFTDGDADPLDDNLHGTHVAGTIAAVGDNGIGVVGVAFESRVMAVRALDTSGQGDESTLAEAVVYAVDNGADVINASWGGIGISQTLGDAVAYAHAHGVVFVAAAGNSDTDSAVETPANEPYAVTVAASDHLDARASFSNFGVKLDVTAPGGGDAPPPAASQQPFNSILSLLSSAIQPAGVPNAFLVVGDRYLRIAGTSMATPHVSGAAALVLAAHPEYSVVQVKQALRTGADDVGPTGPDLDSGYGRVNAAGAVATPAPAEAELTSPRAAEYVGFVSIPITGSAGGPGFVSYTVEYGPYPSPSTWTPIVGPVNTPVEDGALGTWDLSVVPDGVYVLRLRVENTSGTYTDRTEVQTENAFISEPERFSAMRPQDGPVEIRGTAAGVGFTSYAVEYRRPGTDPTAWRTDGLSPAGPQTVPVRNGLLATLDASALTAGDRFDFRLTVNNASGSVTRTRGGIAIDPTLRAGWPQPLLPVADHDYLTVADLDADGRKEILVGSGAQVVVFEPDGSIRPGWPQSLKGVAQGSPIVADIAGDGAPEVIATDRAYLYAWSGDGIPVAGFPLLVDARSGNAWITASDLDGDGKDEVLFAGDGSSQAFHGDGHAVPSWPYWVAVVDSPIAVGDVFGDGHELFAFYNRFFGFDLPRRKLALRGPDRTLLPGWPRGVGGSVFTNVAMADLTGDGQLDLVVLKERHQFTRPGAKAFTPQARTIPLVRLRPPPGIPLTNSGGLLTFGDLDGDGHAEGYLYAFGRSSTTFGADASYVMTIRDRRLGAVAPPAVHPVFATEEPAATAIGDVDGDGEQELVSAAAGAACNPDGCTGILGRRAVLVQHRDGSLDAQFPKPVPEFVLEETDPPGLGIVTSIFVDDPRYETPAIADLQGDGLKEVVWVDPQTSLLLVWDVAGTPGPEHADWPMFRHDPRHTNVLPMP